MPDKGDDTSIPDVAITKVPTVGRLLEHLGFQYASMKITESFEKAAHAWRKAHRTSSGERGSTLLAWKKPQVQVELTTMAKWFLDEGTAGHEFWSSDRTWRQDSDLQYPQDKEEIVKYLKQLFWRQNKYANNNAQYASGQKLGAKINTSSIGPKGKSDQIHFRGCTDPNHTSSQGQPPKAPKSPKTGVENLLDTIAAGDIDRRNAESARECDVQGKPDIFEVPDDSEDEGTDQPLKVSVKITPRACSSEDRPQKRKRSTHDGSPRRTQRKRVPPSRPGFVRGEEVDEIPYCLHDSAPDAIDLVESDLPAVPRSGTPEQGGFAPIAPMVTTRHHDQLQQDKINDFNGANPSLFTFSVKSPQQPAGPTHVMSSEGERRFATEGSARGSWPGSQYMKKSSVPDCPKRITLSNQSSQRALHTECVAKEGGMLGKISRYNVAPLAGEDSDTHIQRIPRAESREVAHEVRPTVNKAVTGLQRSTNTRPTDQKESSTTQHESRSSMKSPPKPIEDKVMETLNITPHEANRIAYQSRGQAKSQIQLWIITREPRHVEELWEEGKVIGTPLDVFLGGISHITERDSIEKIKLTLQTPSFDTKLTVYEGAIDSWEFAKATLSENIKRARAEAKAKKQTNVPSLKIMVEPFYKENIAVHGEIMDDEEEVDF